MIGARPLRTMSPSRRFRRQLSCGTSSKTILMTIDIHGVQLSRRAATRMPRDRTLLLVPGSIGNSTMWVADMQAACVPGAMPAMSSKDNAAATNKNKKQQRTKTKTQTQSLCDLREDLGCFLSKTKRYLLACCTGCLAALKAKSTGQGLRKRFHTRFHSKDAFHEHSRSIVRMFEPVRLICFSHGARTTLLVISSFGLHHVLDLRSG